MNRSSSNVVGGYEMKLSIKISGLLVRGVIVVEGRTIEDVGNEWSSLQGLGEFIDMRSAIPRKAMCRIVQRIVTFALFSLTMKF
jgi:hypothetical protein